MREQIDPKELKTLSDILALVLDDQPGQAANALEAARTRARRNGVTGGALKNLFVSIAPNPPAPKAPPKPRAPRGTAQTANSQAASAAGGTELAASRARISHLTAEMNRLDLDLRGAHSQIQALNTELNLTRAARAEAQQALMATRTLAPKKVTMVMVALCGLLMGIAGTSAVMAILHSAAETVRYAQ